MITINRSTANRLLPGPAASLTKNGSNGSISVLDRDKLEGLASWDQTGNGPDVNQVSKSRNQKLSSVQRIQQTILENLSLTTTLDLLVDQVVIELAVDAVDILFYHPGLKSLRPIAQHGFRQKVFQDIALDIGEGLAGRAADTKTIVHVQDLANSDHQIYRSLEFSTERFVTYFGVPLLAKGRMVGVLEVFNRSPMDPDEDWIDLLKIVAGMAAIAIDQQNLADGLERNRKEIAVAFDGVIMGWAAALELRGIEPKGHAERITELTRRLGGENGFGRTRTG